MMIERMVSRIQQIMGFLADTWEREYNGILKDLNKFQEDETMAPIMTLLQECMIKNIKYDIQIYHQNYCVI